MNIHEFHALGAGVFPLLGLRATTHDKGKAPATPNGKDDATYAPTPVPATPGDAYGMLMPPGWVCIDVDNKGHGHPDGFASLEGLEGYAEDDLNTLTVRTPGGGLHLYFRAEGMSSANGALPGVDIRADDGKFYIVGAGSRTALGEYAVIDEGPPVALPDWLRLGLRSGSTVPTGAEIVRYACAEPPPTKGDLRRVLRRWEKKGDKGRAVAGRVKLALLGHAYADPGERHTTNLQMTSWLAREYPRVDPGVFADQLIEPAWLEMYEDASGVQMARDRWVTQWQGQVDKLECDRRTQAQVKLDVRGGRIRRARYGRTAEPYSVEELEAIATWLGEPVEHLARHAIVQYGGLFWILGLDRAGKPTFRGPRTSSDIVEAARDLLAPFGDLISVETFDENSGKPRLKSRGELMHEHGFTVESTAGVFYGEPGLALEQGSMTLRYARLEPATGVWHEDVDQWLRAFAGDSYEALCDWLAVVTDLEEAAPALWLIGPPGSGKSLLARGVASMWGPHASPVKGNELRNFNAELLQCPVVDFAETLGMSLDDFKEFVTCTEQRIEPKGRDKFPVSGALRIIISSNHENSLRTKRALTKSDLGALSDRMIVVRVGEEAGRLHKDQAQTWLAGPFREHFTWLGEHRAVQSADRLACRALAAGVVDRLMDANEPLQRAAALVVKAAKGQVGFGTECALYYHAREDIILLKVSELVEMSEGKFTVRSLADALGAVDYATSRPIRVRVAANDPRLKSDKDKSSRTTVVRYATLPRSSFERLCELQEEDAEDFLPKVEPGYDGLDEVQLPAPGELKA